MDTPEDLRRQLGRLKEIDTCGMNRSDQNRIRCKRYQLRKKLRIVGLNSSVEEKKKRVLIALGDQSMTIGRLYYLSGVSIRLIRSMIKDGLLTVVGKEPPENPFAHRRCGQSIVRKNR